MNESVYKHQTLIKIKVIIAQLLKMAPVNLIGKRCLLIYRHTHEIHLCVWVCVGGGCGAAQNITCISDIQLLQPELTIIEMGDLQVLYTKLGNIISGCPDTSGDGWVQLCLLFPCSG